MQQAFRCGIYSASVGFTLQFGDKAKQLVVLSGIFLGTGEFIGTITCSYVNISNSLVSKLNIVIAIFMQKLLL